MWFTNLKHSPRAFTSGTRYILQGQILRETKDRLTESTLFLKNYDQKSLSNNKEQPLRNTYSFTDTELEYLISKYLEVFPLNRNVIYIKIGTIIKITEKLGKNILFNTVLLKGRGKLKFLC